MSADRVIFTPRNIGEFRQCDRKLQDIFAWLAAEWPPADLIVGDIWRSEAENQAALAKTEIHVVGPPYRAIDIHVRNLPGDPQQAADAVGALVNARWVYDSTRPTFLVAFTEPHGTGPHVHLQVCERTTLKV